MGRFLAFGAVFVLVSFLVGLLAMSERTLRRLERPTGAEVSTDANGASPVRLVGFGHVDVEGGVVPLTPSVAGQIETIYASAGQYVKAGEPLLQLRRRLAEAQIEQSDARIREAELAVGEAKRKSAQHLLRLQQQLQSIAVATARRDAQARQVDQMQNLSKTGAVSPEDRDTATDRLRELTAAEEVEKLAYQQLKLVDPREAIESAANALTLAQAQLAVAREQLVAHTLEAPEAGVVLRVLMGVGEYVAPTPSQPAIWFCPDRPRIVRCEIDQELANLVRLGMVAEMFDDSAGQGRWTGVVTSCGDWIARRRSVLDEPMQRNDVRTLECVVHVDPDQPTLRIGQRLRVSFRDPPPQTAARENGLAAPPPPP